MRLDEKIAIIDLGSNSIFMIIMQISENGAYKMIDQAKEMVRLSEGMAEVNYLRTSAMKRAFSTLKLFKKLIESHKAGQIIAIATAAVRNATNGKLFLEDVKAETGFDFQLISGELESYYDYLGVINTIDIEDCVIIDTGGGSTEIINVKGRKIKNVISIPYGAVVLTEKFLKKDGETKTSLKKLDDFVKAEIKAIKWLDDANGLTVIGLGGSIRTLAKLHKNTAGFFIDGLHNYSMDSCEVKLIYEQIIGLKINERRKIQGINKDRTDIIAGGLAPLMVLMGHIGSEKLLISGNGLRQGAFYKNFYNLCGMNNETVDDVLDHSINNILKKYDANIPHSKQVCKLALEMFDQLYEIHGLSSEFRKLLAVGALLHDIGLYVDYYDHHSHGFYLALNSGIFGLTPKELVICAFIIALHRNEDFKRTWDEFSLYIDKKDYEAIQQLGMLVRIAEGLDRNEYGNVEGIKCYVSDKNVKMVLTAKRFAVLEIAAATLSSKSFKKMFDRDLYIDCV